MWKLTPTWKINERKTSWLLKVSINLLLQGKFSYWSGPSPCRSCLCPYTSCPWSAESCRKHFLLNDQRQQSRQKFMTKNWILFYQARNIQTKDWETFSYWQSRQRIWEAFSYWLLTGDVSASPSLVTLQPVSACATHRLQETHCSLIRFGMAISRTE